MKAKYLILLFCLLFSLENVSGQRTSGSAQIEGVVLETETNSPVPYAAVMLFPSEASTITDINGGFAFRNVDPGPVNVKIQFLGKETIDTTLTIHAGMNQWTFHMKASTFYIQEVTVTAKQSKDGRSTSSTISRQAMDHLQANSLKDLMQLLPGGQITNPNLSSANNIALRTLSGSGESFSMNSLGTSIVVDGAPISNNANMQSLSPAISGNVGSVGGGTSPGSGIDLRNISTDNIESVEVIRGIPSAEYGDLTSGVVLIRSKAGKEPLSIRLKTNPLIYQASVSKGFLLGKEWGNLNLSGDYAYNVNSQTQAYAYFQRMNLKALWSRAHTTNFRTNTSLDFIYGLDKRDKNPDDIRSQLASGAKENGIRFNTNGHWGIDRDWLKFLNFTVSFSYADKHSYQEQLLGNAFAPYSQSFIDGAILSNRPGQKVFDTLGNELTHIYPDEASYYATYLPNEYFSRYDIYGKELNGFSKLTTTFNKNWGKVNNRTLLGADFKTDGNLGDGKVYDQDRPPYRSVSAENAMNRPRAYSEIPFVNQLGIFLENNFLYGLDGPNLQISTGVRYDNINSLSSITPRLNASVHIIPSRLVIRGGYGIAAKAPVSLYLYPEPAYFDYVNFNNLGSQTVPENEQLLLSTTRSFNTENKDLKIATNEKLEAGFDILYNKIRFSVTGYKENLKNGYSFGRNFENFRLLEYNRYVIGKQVPGSIPLLTLGDTYNIFAIYSTPLNTLTTQDKGIEYELDFGRIDAIRTSIYLNGAWMHTILSDDGYSYSTLKDRNNLERHIGIYAPGTSTSNMERLLTTLRLTHNIPNIGFVLTLTTQVKWFEKFWTDYKNDDMFIKYISYKDGLVHDFNPALKNDPEFSYLFPALNENRFIAEKYFPVTTFNFQLTKEIRDILTASFFANNMFNYRPLYESQRTKGSFTELNTPIFFGFDLKLNIK